MNTYEVMIFARHETIRAQFMAINIASAKRQATRWMKRYQATVDLYLVGELNHLTSIGLRIVDNHGIMVKFNNWIMK